MKHFTSILFLMLCTVFVSQAQLNVLYVLDTDIDSTGNANLTAALTNSGCNFTTFDAATDSVSPTFSTDMSDKDLVIWYTGSNGVGLQLWAGADTINTELYQYLNNGGSLWVIGNDFLYDLYDAPPVYFTPTDQASVLFGIDSYDVQSYGSDSNTGVSEMDVVSGQSITAQSPLTFIWATLWWADGVTPASGTQAVYEMGPGSYALSGAVSGTYYDNSVYKVLAYYFNAGVLGTQTSVDQAVKDVIDFFQTTGVPEQASAQSLLLFPNPVQDELHMFWSGRQAPQHMRIMDASGRIVREHTLAPHTSTVNMRDLASGVYHVQVTLEDGQTVGKTLIR
ncbi:MAG: T9SS type A sorting domain-containing protein [Flavobacteriales bacterium]|nr:T9SS type A sorting domain-containing protein [Flavobacteriales bacterium]MCB9449124.1 T9SS type A sorting domain-containing protein [Flavobacteriales bacterium]